MLGTGAMLGNTNTAKMSKRYEHVVSEIVDQYLFDEHATRPWIVGFSGGKDSTVLLQMVWQAISGIPIQLRTREIHVVCNDTLVENPLIAFYVKGVLELIQQAAKDQSLPIFVHRTIPRLEHSFWFNLIGYGYPAPNSMFRWCTERLKIKPTKRFLEEALEDHQEAIVLLGSRSDESQTRAATLKRHEIKGSRLTRHGQERNTWVYAPIKHLSTEEIWGYINTTKSPWGGSNDELFQLYADASADDYECPTVVTNKNHKSCGQSRFGCWVCTVVKEDKSMSALIANGVGWMQPLLNLRNSLAENRNIPENRMRARRNGSEDSWGPYTPSYRAQILADLLTAQKQVQAAFPSIELISNQELIAIQTIWLKDGIFEYNVAEIFASAYGKEISMGKNNEKIRQEHDLLKKVCQDAPDDFDLIQKMLVLQKNKSLLNKKKGLRDDLEKQIEDSIKEAQ